MSPNSDLPTTSVLFIDGFDADRRHFADQLKRRSRDYEILEAADGQSGLDIYRSQRIDCVVLEMTLPDQSGLEVLMSLIPRASRPRIAVVVLTQLSHPGLWELTKQNGAYVCFVKRLTTAEDLDRAIWRAMGYVGWMPKEDQYRPS